MAFYRRHLPHWQPDGAALFVTWRLHDPGARWLGDEAIAHCIVDALHYGEQELHLYHLQAWVVMINHVHMLINPEAPVAKITKTLKGYTARQANKLLNRTGQPFWQEESFDHWVRGPDEFEQIVRYIEQNPVAAGLVSHAQAWRWSSASRTDLQVCPPGRTKPS